VCATIPNRIKVEFPTASGYPAGALMLYQESVSSDLMIMSDLTSLEGATDGNKWHVHQFPTNVSSVWDCGSTVTGGHYNPNFATTCVSSDFSTCEVGDLSGKHGRLGIGATTDTTSWTDSQASILYDSAPGSRGSMWIVGRSIVIHKDDASRWSCATIGEAGTGVSVDFTGDEVPGSIELFQPNSGYEEFNYAFTTSSHYHTAITVSLSGLEASPGNKWHVHVDPVPTFGECGSTGGHYDPLTASTSPVRGAYEIGDLSGKHGYLNGASGNFSGTPASTQGYVLDYELPLEGNYSVVGRSIVVHRNDATASRWVCATTLTNAITPYNPPPVSPPPPVGPPPSPPPLPVPATDSSSVSFTIGGLPAGATDDLSSFIDILKSDLIADLRASFGESYDVPADRLVVEIVETNDAAGTANVTVTVYSAADTETDTTVGASDFVNKVREEASEGSLVFPSLGDSASAIEVVGGSSGGGGGGGSMGIIVAVVVVLLLLIAVVAAACCMMKRKKGGRTAKDSVKMVDNHTRSQTRSAKGKNGANGADGGAYQMAVKDHTALKANQA